jgi:hypothetical protein
VTSSWRQSVLLGRTFFGRLFESDLMPPGLPQVQLIIWSMVFLAAPAMFVPITGIAKYDRLEDFPGMLAQAISTDRLFLFTYAMIAMGFLGLVTWDGVFPDRRDARILGPLPISPRTLMLARLGAVCYMFGLFFCVTQLPAAVIFGIIGGGFDSPGGVVGGVAGQVIATGLASAFPFFALIAIQCALLNALGRGAVQQVAVVLQTLFAASLVLMLLFFPQLSGTMRDGNLAPDWMSSPLARLLPSVWFLAVYEALTGFGGRGTYSMAIPAVTTTAGVVAAAIVLYAASYARLTRRALETPPGSGGRARALWPQGASGRTPAWLRQSPVKRAVCAFTLRTLARSRQHRLLLCLYVALALAFVLSGIVPLILKGDPAALARPGVAVTSAPLVVMFFVLVGLRALFAIPIEPKANWTFRLREPGNRRAVIAGVRRALIVACVLPVTIAAGTSVGIPWGARLGLAHALFCALMGILLTELLLIRFCKVPFTCTYFPGRARLRTLWPFYLIGFSTYTYTAALLEADVLLRSIRAYTIFCLLVAFAIALLALARALWLTRAAGLTFDESDPDAVFAGFSLSEGLAAQSPRVNPLSLIPDRESLIPHPSSRIPHRIADPESLIANSEVLPRES